MDTQKNDEKNIVLELKHQLGRMMVQVDYMYRNDREMSRLDLDIMMERTRDLYDLLCDYQAGKLTNEVVDNEHVNTEINEGGELINRDVEFEIETPADVLKEPEPEPEIVEEKEVEEEPEEQPAETIHVLPVDENDDDDEEDWEDEDDEMFRIEQPAEEKLVEEVKPVEEPKPVEKTKPVEEDNSLAARLQRAHVSDIRMALGINDKIMIVNDLFMGSVERYNKSIDALNDFPTLSGARVYMSELQIELQWDTECQAYKMLNDLVERRFV